MIAVAAARVNLKWFVLGLMAAALAWNIRFPSFCYGIFIEYWAHFAIGCLLFYRLCGPMSRRMRWLHDGLLLGTAVYCGWLSGNWAFNPVSRSIPQELCVAATFALALIVLRRFDDWFKESLVGVALIGLGTISYSLYLNHQFNLTMVHSIAARLVPHGWPPAFLIAAQCALHVLMAAPFWYLFERPFLHKSLSASGGATMRQAPV
jgi:peptidoglycan/LPS O-acetylase OafA/YrhL